MEKYDHVIRMYVLIILASSIAIAMYFVGKAEVVNNCRDYGAYVISSKEKVLCVVKPIIENNQGELNYLRPHGKKAIQV